MLTLIETKRAKTLADLSCHTGYSRMAVVRLLKIAKDEMCMRVEWVRGRGYVINDWGVLDKECVVESFSETEPVNET